jgi:hypothetical protein
LIQVKRPACRRAEHGRPASAEEFWVISLTSRDEVDTVVWTTECAEAFSLAKPIL